MRVMAEDISSAIKNVVLKLILSRSDRYVYLCSVFALDAHTGFCLVKVRIKKIEERKEVTMRNEPEMKPVPVDRPIQFGLHYSDRYRYRYLSSKIQTGSIYAVPKGLKII